MGKFLFVFVVLTLLTIFLSAESNIGFEYLDENLRILYQHEITEPTSKDDKTLESALRNRRQRKENIVEQYWDMINEEWKYFTETRYIYDEEGALLKTILFNYQDQYKVQSGLDELTHDDSGKLIKVIQKRDFDLDKTVRLKNYKTFEYKYDAKGNLVEEKLRIWDRINWENESLKKYTYNFDGSPREIRKFKWNGRDWEIAEKHKFQYDDQHKLQIEIKEGYFQGQVFSTRIIEHKYNEENELIESLTKSGVMGQWKLEEFRSYQYDKKGKLAQEMIRKFEKNNWVNKNVYLYVYDKRDSLSKKFEKIWNSDQTWISSKKTEFYYKLIK